MNQVIAPDKKLLVIDSQVSNWQSLTAGIGTDTALLILDSGSDGLTQISDHLTTLATSTQDFVSLQSLQIISQGSVGSISLGSTTFTTSTLEQYTSQLATIGNALTDTGNILLYGCNVSAISIGLDFINQFATLTSAEVVASTDLIGATALDGGTLSGLVLTGDENANVLSGDVADDTLIGLGGDDVLNGYWGNDNLQGGDGNDVLTGDQGNDTLIGGLGADNLSGGQGDDLLIAGVEGSNIDIAWTGNVLDGGEGNDTLIGSDDASTNDYSYDYSYDYGGDQLNGGQGNDTLSGLAGADYLNDSGYHGESNSLSGGEGNDTVSLSSSFYANNPNPFGYSGGGSNTLTGDNGNDQLSVNSTDYYANVSY